jgi:hypothetical protein
VRKLVIAIVLVCFLAASLAIVGCGDKSSDTSVKKAPAKKMAIKKSSAKKVKGMKKKKKVGGMKTTK